MTETLTIALAQLDPTVGDVVGNARMLRAARTRAAGMGADLMVASELVISGYPPEDLVLRPSFQESVVREVARTSSCHARKRPSSSSGLSNSPPRIACSRAAQNREPLVDVIPKGTYILRL